MERGNSRVKFTRKRVALHVWVAIIGAMLALNIAENKELYLPQTDGRYLLTGSDCSDQTGRNDFEAWDGWILWFLCWFQGWKVYFSVCFRSHIYVYYPLTEEKRLTMLLCLEK